MRKKPIGPMPLLYPMPSMLVGATIDGKANFMLAAWGGAACHSPAMISVAVRPERYTYKGIKANRTFSVNIPPTTMAREADLCGIVSGSTVNKADICNFTVVPGKLGTAPMIAECPISLELSVHDILELGSHHLILGRVEECYVSEDCLTGGKPDPEKIDPLVYMGGGTKIYARIGDTLAKAFSAGETLKQS